MTASWKTIVQRMVIPWKAMACETMVAVLRPGNRSKSQSKTTISISGPNRNSNNLNSIIFMLEL